MIDLHTHSTCSDGSESPASVVEHAVASGCSAVALTDHDNLDGLAEARAKARTLGVRLVPGCEVSCSTPSGTMHLLCYFIEEGDGPLQRELAALQRDREQRNEVMAERLLALGLPITYGEVLAEAGGTGVGRPHFAAVLVRHGLASSVNDAFERYLAKGRPGYVPKTRVEAPEIIELCRRSGGCAVLAHPLSLELEGDDLRRRLAELAATGLTGLECYYGRYEPDERRRLAKLASELGLVATGGSDYHGSYKPDLEVGTGRGDLEVPEAALAELDERRPDAP
ncbi:MAG: PHP domain-containing protein [Actinomycetota bacterium]|nr:PHP domain-containing protein [Actinomycetota bacterium]